MIADWHKPVKVSAGDELFQTLPKRIKAADETPIMMSPADVINNITKARLTHRF